MGVRERECLVERIMSVVVVLSASLSLVVVGLIQLAHCCGGGGVLRNVALLMWECRCGVCWDNEMLYYVLLLLRHDG